jgi:hypothetical protein
MSDDQVLQPERRRLPNKGDSELVTFESLGLKFTASISRYLDGEIGEMFIDPAKPGSTINTLVHDMGIAFSFAVQHGASAADILRALDCDQEGRPLSPLGVALDLLLKRLPDFDTSRKRLL